MTVNSEENMDMKMIKEITKRILILMAMHMEDESQSHTGKDLYMYALSLQRLWDLRCSIREK